MIPARVRSEWSRLKGKGIPSIWAPASQDSSHVGSAGVGVVSLRGAPLALPSFATAQFKSFLDCGRALRCLLPIASGRFLHLFVLYGYQGADTDSEQLALTTQLFDAALGELHVVASGQPCLLVGDFNVEPTKIPCLAKGISAGLWVDFEEAWSLAAGLHPAPTCKRSWTAAGGHRRDFMVGCRRAAAAVFSCKVQPDRWIAPHLAVRTLFDCCRWECRVTQPVQRTLLWPASWLLAVDKSRSSRSAEVQRVWEVYDERLKFKSPQDASLLVHQVVVHRRDEAIRGWRNWVREDPLVHPYRWLRPDLVPPAPFLQCEPCLTSGGSGVLSDPARIDEEFRKAWLPYFCRSGQRETSLDEFSFEVDGWLPLLPEVQLPRLTGQMLADVVLHKGVSAGSLDGREWRELKALPVSWFDELARILTKVEDLGVWPDGLLGCLYYHDP